MSGAGTAGEASALIQAHFGRVMAGGSFQRLMEMLQQEPSKPERQTRIEHLLRLVLLTPDQVMSLARSEAVRDNGALQLALKRYAREREYAAERKRFAERSEWAKLLEVLSAPF